MQLKINRVEGLDKFAKTFIAFVKNEGMVAMLGQAKKEVNANTDKGLDYQDTAFKEYAKSTQSRKRRHGQRVSPPNLIDSGEMRSSLSIIDISGEKVLTVSDKSADKAGYTHYGTTRMPARKWLALNRGNANRMARIKDALIKRWKEIYG